MKPSSPPPGRNPKLIRLLTTIYGIVMINVGALSIYDSLSAPEIVFDTNFRIGLACLLLGAVALYFARRSKKNSP